MRNLSANSINILYIEHLNKATVRAKCIKLVTCLCLHFIHILNPFVAILNTNMLLILHNMQMLHSNIV